MTDWPVKTLGEVCDLVGGGTPSKDRLEFYGGEIPWATVRDLNVEVLRTTEHSITAEAVKSSSSNIIPAGSVVIATRVGLGKAVKIAQDTAINQDLRGLVVKKPKELIADYLYWWYLSTVHLVVAAGTGATVQGVKLPFVSGLAIPVPPLEEQKRIVALLDAATARVTELTACYEQARTHANNLFTSALRDALESNPDWPVKTLGDIVCFESETARSEDLSSRDVYVGLENIASDGTLIGLGSVSAETLKSNKARFTDKHILFGKLRPYLVKVVRPDFPGVCSTDILPLEPTAELSRDFLYWYMRSPAVIERATEASTGTTLPRVSPTTLKSFEISVPPLGEQKQIVAQLDLMRAKTSEMVAAYDVKLTAAKNLRQSILESAFKGKL